MFQALFVYERRWQSQHVKTSFLFSTSGSRKWTLSANARVLLCPLKEGFQRTARCTGNTCCGARRSSQTQKVHKRMTQNGYPTFDGDEKSTLLKKVQTKDARDEKGMRWRLRGRKAFILDEFRKWWRVDSTEFKYVQVSETCCWMPLVKGVFFPFSRRCESLSNGSCAEIV